MAALFLQKSIEINAPVAKVWTVLTRPEFTRQWSGPFGASGPVDSDWQPGSHVLWRNAEGQVYVSGRVIAAEPNRLLRFSVRSAQSDRQPISGREEDDVTQTYALSGHGGHTSLAISHGDFGAIPDGRDVVPGASAIWDQVLQRIKDLAERGE